MSDLIQQIEAFMNDPQCTTVRFNVTDVYGLVREIYTLRARAEDAEAARAESEEWARAAMSKMMQRTMRVGQLEAVLRQAREALASFVNDHDQAALSLCGDANRTCDRCDMSSCPECDCGFCQEARAAIDAILNGGNTQNENTNTQ